jgi:hypothetical protein
MCYNIGDNGSLPGGALSEKHDLGDGFWMVHFSLKSGGRQDAYPGEKQGQSGAQAGVGRKNRRSSGRLLRKINAAVEVR